MISKRLLISLLVLSLLPLRSGAQRTLTLEECRQMAIQEDENLKQARTKYEMAGYDKKIALANYFPNISATGAARHGDAEFPAGTDPGHYVESGCGNGVRIQPDVADSCWSYIFSVH